jgi:drug/metabolite transporter (DMT)-like permease
MFGATSVALRKGVLKAAVSQGVFVTVILGVPLFAVAALLTRQLMEFAAITSTGYILLGASGIVHFLLGRYCAYRGIAAIGANRMETVLAMQIPFSVVVAILFLNETITGMMIFAIVLIMAGPAIIMEKPNKTTIRPSTGDEPAFVLKQTEGYVFGLLASVWFGTSPILIRAGLEGTDLAMLGGLVAYIAAAVVLLVALAIPVIPFTLKGLTPSAAKLFLTGTITVFFAQMFRFLALAYAPVTIVQPLSRSGSIFTYLLSYGVNRKVESFGPRVVIGITISIAGSLLLIL